MHFFRIALVAAAFIPPCLFAQSPRSVDAVTHGKMQLVARSGHAQIIAARTSGVPLVAQSSRSDAGAVGKAVGAWVGANAAELFGLGVGAELREYAHTKVDEVWQTSYELRYNAIPVRERSVKINTGVQSGAILMIRSMLPKVQPAAMKPAIPVELVEASAAGEVSNEPKEIADAQLVYIDNGKTLQLAYEVIAGSPHRERYRLTYDAQTGKLIEKKSLLFDRCFEGAGEMSDFVPLPGATLRAHQLPQASIGGRLTALVNLMTPTDQLEEVGLPYMEVTVNGTKATTDSLGYWTLPSATYPLIIMCTLSNANFNVRTSGQLISVIADTITSGPANLQWNDENSSASDRDALYSLLRTRAYIKALDPNLKNIDKLLRAEVDYDATCNALYDPADQSFTFFKQSSTCNSTARVADVVFHEYGHRVNHCYYLGTAVQNMQDGSLNEGFADIYSALQRDDPRIGNGFYVNPSQILRNCQNTRKWPNNIAGDPHTNGSIIAGAYWDLRKATDITTARRLFVKTCALTPDGNGAVDAVSLGDAFTNVLVATILADDDDNDLSNGTPHLDAIFASFKKHNITLAGLLDLVPEQLDDQPVTADGYPISVKATYTAPVGALDESSVTLHYTTGSAYTALPLTKSAGNNYVAVIPKVDAGSIVHYYATAKTTLGDENETPLRETPMKFFVGFEKKFVDDFETHKGWLKTDSGATSGRWERGDPFGTSFAGAELQLVQQDTDHTAAGVSCYVTGNLNTSTPSADDVDNGIVRLTSPSFDMSAMNDPHIRYWYHYSNNMGQNPGMSKFVVEVSDGETWYEAKSTTLATEGWQQELIRIKDIVKPGADIRVRFVASDLIGSLVEAGVDDFEVLDPAGKQGVDAPAVASQVEVYPQPVTGNTLHIASLPAEGVAQVALKDLLGVTVLTATIAPGGGELSVASVVNGVYVLEVRSGTLYGQQKIVVMR